MSTPFVHRKKVLGNLSKQIEGFAAIPQLGDGMPIPPAELSEMERRFRELDARHDGAKQALSVLTELVGQALFDLREATAANLANARIRYGRYAGEVDLLGGVSLKGRRSKSSAPATPSSTTGTDERPAGGESKDEKTLTA